jgi:hypothetical protein
VFLFVEFAAVCEQGEDEGEVVVCCEKYGVDGCRFLGARWRRRRWRRRDVDCTGEGKGEAFRRSSTSSISSSSRARVQEKKRKKIDRTN